MTGPWLGVGVTFTSPGPCCDLGGLGGLGVSLGVGWGVGLGVGLGVGFGGLFIGALLGFGVGLGVGFGGGLLEEGFGGAGVGDAGFDPGSCGVGLTIGRGDRV
jgi:hypothetical protein